MTPERGEIVWIDFNPRKGHEQSGRRPALVISPKAYNEVSSCVLVCPITTNLSPWPWKIELSGVEIEGAVLVDQIKSIDPIARHIEGSGSSVKDDDLHVILDRLATLTR